MEQEGDPLSSPRATFVVTLIHMTSKLCSPASFNSTHSTDVVKRHFIGHSVSLPVLTEDIRNLYPRHFRTGVEAKSCWM